MKHMKSIALGIAATLAVAGAFAYPVQHDDPTIYARSNKAYDAVHEGMTLNEANDALNAQGDIGRTGEVVMQYTVPGLGDTFENWMSVKFTLPDGSYLYLTVRSNEVTAKQRILY